MFDAAVTASHIDTIRAGLDAWAACDVTRLSAVALQHELQMIEALRARLDALSAARLARVPGDPRAWARHKLGLSGRDARERARTAEACEALPAAAAALATGDISAAHVSTLALEAKDLDHDRQAMLIEQAKTLPPDEIAKRARLAVMAASGDDGAADAHRQWERRVVLRSRNPDGMRVLHAELDAQGDQILFNALDLVMDQQWRALHPDREPQLAERPPYGQRMADALVEMGRRTLAGGSADIDASNAPRPTLYVLVDYATLLDRVHAHTVCESDDGQPISPATVRRLACDAQIIPVVMNGAGEVLDVGRAKRLATPAQRVAVYARDRHCTEPGCDVPARWCEVHHKVWREHGGPTDLDNLELKCPRHHRLIHEGQHQHRRTRAGPSP